MDALSSLRPEADKIANAWYIGRREQTLQQVLTRAGQSIDRSGEPITSATPKWHHPRRTLLVGVLAIAALAIGAAGAFTRYAVWYTGGALTDLTCMTVWSPPGDPDHADQQYGGAPLTTDPVSDCNRYAELTGKPRVASPVAVRWNGALVVGPGDTRPDGAIPLTRAEDERVFELEKSLDDYVDGGLSQCLDESAATQFARAELKRLGLTGWTVTIREQDPLGGPCAGFLVAEPGAIEVRTFMTSIPFAAPSGLSRVLRSQIAEKCLSLSQAEAVVEKALGSDHHWATSSRVDAGAACTRVDLNIGGSRQ
ncbi:MAG: hypothetical protein VB093_18430, partial [Propionicimonas sp.]|nr:hypothetical protein [Propionicimonas sp.]